MKNNERWMLEWGQALRCSTTSCRCEGVKTFPDSPQERYCTDCYDAIKSVRMARVIPK